MTSTNPPPDAVGQFVRASVWYGSIERAEQALAACPQLADYDIVTATLTGRRERVEEILQRDPEAATRPAGCLGWDPLTYLSFSKFLRDHADRTADFVAIGRLLLDHGASAKTGFFNSEHTPRPCLESAIYGAAGVAFSPELTGLLLEHGADPNDEETPYHAAETYDNRTLEVLVSSGRLNADSLATLLLRKCDWHDGAGVKYLLDHGADPNRMTVWGYTALHQAIRRDNHRSIVEALLAHGADPAITERHRGRNAIAMAAWRGRADLLDLLGDHTPAIDLTGLDAVVAAAARGDLRSAERMIGEAPELRDQLLAHGGTLAGHFAGNGNTAGLEVLFQLGTPVDATFADEDGYWELAADSTPLHVAAWRAQHSTVRRLVELGADVHRRDSQGRTALQLAVRAGVASHWMELRAPESVAALLAAGADPDEVSLPTGYEPFDALIARARDGGRP